MIYKILYIYVVYLLVWVINCVGLFGHLELLNACFIFRLAKLRVCFHAT